MKLPQFLSFLLIITVFGCVEHSRTLQRKIPRRLPLGLTSGMSTQETKSLMIKKGAKLLGSKDNINVYEYKMQYGSLNIEGVTNLFKSDKLTCVMLISEKEKEASKQLERLKDLCLFLSETYPETDCDLPNLEYGPDIMEKKIFYFEGESTTLNIFSSFEDGKFTIDITYGDIGLMMDRIDK